MEPRRLLVVLLFATTISAPSFAQNQRGCSKPECFAATLWHAGYTAVFLNTDDPKTSRDANEFIKASGGRIAIETDNVLLGWIDPKLDHLLIGHHGIVRVTRSVIDPASIPFRSDRFRARQNQIASTFFNSVVSGALAAQVDGAINVRGTPLVGDVAHTENVRGTPLVGYVAHTENVHAFPAGTWSSGGLHVGAENFNGPPWTNERMTGNVIANVFEIQSDGTIDPSLYHWTQNDFTDITTQALAGLSFWSNQAANYGRSVSFGVGVWEPYNAPCNQGYEPINHTSGDDYLWINEVMRKYTAAYWGGRPGGYGATPITYTNVFNNVEQFNYDQEHVPGYSPYDWGFSVFVAYNPYGAPSTFTDGHYAYTTTYGGPWVQMCFTNDGWGTGNFNRIMTHETGHIFWACDEYFQAGYGGCTTCATCRTFGPRLAAPNRNCNNPSTSCSINATCMMRTNDFALCDDTPTQIGWRE